MGRPEKPVDHTVPALGALAEHLRAMRRDAGMTYQQLAKRSHYSPAQLKRAASGVTLPRWGLVAGYTMACADFTGQTRASWLSRFREAQHLHDAARDAVRRARAEARRSTVLPKPQYVRDEADLSGALRDAWERAGRPPMRAMEAAVGGQLPRSTAHAICKGRTVPRDFRQFVAFLLACEVPAMALGPWYRAWMKLYGVPSDKAIAAVLAFLGGERQFTEPTLEFSLQGLDTDERIRKMGSIASHLPVPDWAAAWRESGTPQTVGREAKGSDRQGLMA